MIAINEEYSIDVEHEDGGVCMYSLYNSTDDCVLKREGGTAWTSNAEAMKLFGESMLDEYLKQQQTPNQYNVICMDCKRDFNAPIVWGGHVCAECSEKRTLERTVPPAIPDHEIERELTQACSDASIYVDEERIIEILIESMDADSSRKALARIIGEMEDEQENEEQYLCPTCGSANCVSCG